MSDGRTLGQINYEGYCARSDGVSLVSGEGLPAWDDLSPVIAEAWEAAAQAVVSAGRGEETEVR
jgi:hypothetical protein